MANFKRGKCRYQSSPHVSRRSTSTYWMSNWPRWWDILYHTRPRRAKEKRLERAITSGNLDPDAVAWPLGNSRPHRYYW